jgi:hypothetical protein
MPPKSKVFCRELREFSRIFLGEKRFEELTPKSQKPKANR